MHQSALRSSSICCAALAALCIAWLPGAARASEPSRTGAKDTQAKAAPPVEFDEYHLVLLRRGPAWTPEKTPAIQKLQAEHLAHMRRMAEAGKLVVAGPFGKQQDETLRGMCLYKTATQEEARKLAEEDPAVKAGRLKVEILTWYVEKGALAFPRAVTPPAPAKGSVH